MDRLARLGIHFRYRWCCATNGCIIRPCMSIRIYNQYDRRIGWNADNDCIHPPYILSSLIVDCILCYGTFIPCGPTFSLRISAAAYETNPNRNGRCKFLCGSSLDWKHIRRNSSTIRYVMGSNWNWLEAKHTIMTNKNRLVWIFGNYYTSSNCPSYLQTSRKEIAKFICLLSWYPLYAWIFAHSG